MRIYEYMFHRVCICCGEAMRPAHHLLSPEANLCPSCRKLAEAFCSTDNSSLIEEAKPAALLEPEDLPIPEPGSSRSIGLIIPPLPIDSPDQQSSFSE